jgi:hypothetical protein
VIYMLYSMLLKFRCNRPGGHIAHAFERVVYN